VKKHGNAIGDLNTTGFSVKSTTLPRYGTGRGDSLVLHTHIPGMDTWSYTMRRYWTIAGASTPTTAVDVMFPFLQADTTDVDGSVPGYAPLTTYRMYKVNSPIDPNPANHLVGASSTNTGVYSYAATASAINWSLTTVGVTHFADMKMLNLNGGGTGIYTYGSPASVASTNTSNTNVIVYPNPTHDQWFVSVANLTNTDALSFQLYTADGKLAQIQTLQSGKINSIDASALPTGIYYYRITNNNTEISTGSLLKK
jgi:hypothetical protein